MKYHGLKITQITQFFSTFILEAYQMSLMEFIFATIDNSF